MTPFPIHYIELENIYSQTLGSGMRTLAVTSSEPEEGVSSLAHALVRRHEQAGYSVLLVDFNRKAPSVAQHIGEGYQSPPSHPLLQENTQEKNRLSIEQKTTPQPQDVEENNLLQTAIIRHPERKLALLPAPKSPQVALRLRENSVLTETISAWQQEFDAIVFDTSAINSINHANIPTETVSSHCEGTLLIVLAGVTSTVSVQTATQKLSDAGARLVGTVFNDRFNPSLADELCRETHRFDRWLPKLMQKLRSRIRRSALLTVPV
ncbi:CpsD/CapB family tyrosine-protein kinase [Magnetococcales bacterium HHB-1]